jgi:hypothetical protein
MTKIPKGVRTAGPSVRTVNCNRLSKIALKASITRPRSDGLALASERLHFGCTKLPHKAWSVRTLKANVQTVELVHVISIYEA